MNGTRWPLVRGVVVIDELNSGAERSARPWVSAVVVCLAVLAAVALLTRTGSHAKTARPPTVVSPPFAVPTGSYEISLPPSTPPQPTDGPIGNRAAPPSAPPAFVPSQLDGVTAPIPKGIRLLLGGVHPTELGGNPHQFSHVPIHANQSVIGIVPVKDGFVVEVYDSAAKPEVPAEAAYWVRPDGRASLITRTAEVIPSQAGDRIFAYQGLTGAANAAKPQVGHLIEVTLAGQVVVSHTLAAGLIPLADSPDGLVFTDLARAKIEIRDRHTLAERKDIAPADADVNVDRGWLVASADPFCNVGCELTVQNMATGKRYRVALADHLYVGQVAVNPNGHSVAISYWGATSPGSVVVAELASRATEEIPGVVVENRRVADLAWTPDGGTLAISVSFDQHEERRIALWPAGGGPLAVLPGSQPGANLPWSLATF